MGKKPTVTIGVPAYNEEANIKNLLVEILEQNRSDYVLEKIIVNSDGSSDNTVNEVRKIKNKRIYLLDNKENKGQAFRQNEIIKECTSDILILINADLALNDKRFLKNLILPIIQDMADFTSANLVPLEPGNFFESILFTSVLFKNEIYGDYNGGNNVMTCHGAARAFSRKYYQSFSFESSVGEDAYSYFYGMVHGLRYEYCKNAILYYRLPNNVKDHEKQSVRYFKSQELMSAIFGDELVKSYKSPFSLLFFKLLKYLLKNPIGMLSYIGLVVLMKMKSRRLKEINKEVWTPSVSSKSL